MHFLILTELTWRNEYYITVHNTLETHYRVHYRPWDVAYLIANKFQAMEIASYRQTVLR